MVKNKIHTPRYQLVARNEYRNHIANRDVKYAIFISAQCRSGSITAFTA